jgi:hypothetical protein
VKHGLDRKQGQPGSVTFIQRFGGSINLNLHFHLIFLEGVYVDRTEQGLKPRFVKVAPPTDTDIAEVVQKITRRVIRKLRQLGYLEAEIDTTIATGYDLTTNLNWPVRWPPQCSSALPVASGPDKRYGALARASATQVSARP